MEMYTVGGCVRDELLGVKSKDIDFTVVISGSEALFAAATDRTLFEYMSDTLLRGGFKIFLETPEYLTIRAKFPKGHENENLTADFVLARKESGYTDNRRPDFVEPGTLMDDLRRRDFTMNAIAKINGDYIDPFKGINDINDRIIRAVGDPRERFEEDALRILRAMRFSVTKGFTIERDTRIEMFYARESLAGVSAERVREELTKMFNANPRKTIDVLDDFNVFDIIFDMGINFQPTMKEKIR